MNLSYKYKRFYVQSRLKFRANKYKKAIGNLDTEQIKVFSMVMNMAKKNSEDIKFDPESSETLIVLSEMLVTIKPYVVHIDNTHGFRSTRFPQDAYEIMDSILIKEAHRVRRKLKNDVKMRINLFLNKVIEKYDLNDKKPEESKING